MVMNSFQIPSLNFPWFSFASHACYHWLLGRRETQLSIFPPYEVAESNEVISRPSLLQAGQSKYPQPLFAELCFLAILLTFLQSSELFQVFKYPFYLVEPRITHTTPSKAVPMLNIS